MMFRWLFPNENALTPAENAAWKLSALRIILVSGFLLEIWIAVHTSASAFASGNYKVIWAVGLLYVIKSVAIYYSTRSVRASAGLLILNIYGVTLAVVTLIQDHQIAALGYILVYAAPLIARLFLGLRLALWLMFFNIFPFLFLISRSDQYGWPDLQVSLSSVQTDVHALIFLFFNFCLPLAVFRVLHELDSTLTQFTRASKALKLSHAQYQEIFENAGTALILTDPAGQILQANNQANTLLGRQSHGEQSRDLFSWLLMENSVRLQDKYGQDTDELRLSAYQTRDGKMVVMNNISQTSTGEFIVALSDVSSFYAMHNALQLSIEREDYLSSHDLLTNLPNRDMLRHHLTSVLANQDGIHVTALVSFRLNSIRHANQQFGAPAGDTLLRRFADELGAVLPENSFCTRLRSIVFSFVLERFQTPGDVVLFVEQIREKMPKEIEINGEMLQVQFSAGIALLRNGESEPDDLIRRSEMALDAARKSSDQSTSLFDDAEAQEIRRNIEIEVGIISGLKHNEFHLMYQPKICHQGKLAGVEALLRWDSASLGRVSPAEFIPVAEHSGLIHHISDFVLDAVCAQIRLWLDTHGESPVVALNLSVIDLARTDLIELIEERCQHYRIETRYLELEITETGLIANEAISIQHLNALKKRGFSIAIDDFGTGYSSLSKLSHFPAHTVKIDRSFVAQIGYNPKSEMIIKAIISLAEILSCKTVAEGVENGDQESFLKQVGCDFFQGYYFYHPLNRRDMSDLLVSNLPLLQQAS
ncbi:MAG: EAL domain-containing protein [Burkholderiaceae bacterium]|nr:EAL domain-containing protein [Burkholderiaceae bacterium]